MRINNSNGLDEQFVRNIIEDEDFEVLREVVQYLTIKGLDVELGGSALKGDKDYRDVDLLATGSFVATTNTVRGLLRVPEVGAFPQATTDGRDYQVEHLGRNLNYFGTTVDERYMIQAGKTKIDLSLHSFR